MLKIELNDTIDTRLPKNDIFKKIMDYIKQNQIKVKKINDKQVNGMYGSRLQAHMRGIFAKPSILPVKIFIQLHNGENETELHVKMKEGFIGIPPLGMKKKYLPLFARLMNNLKLQFYKNDINIGKHEDKCPNCDMSIINEHQRFCEACGYELFV